MAPRQHHTAIVGELCTANAQLRAANQTLARHFTQCYKCTKAGRNTGLYCDTGWEIAKDQERAQAAIRDATDRALRQPVQGELW